MPKDQPQIEKLGQILDKSLKRLELSGKLGEYGVWPIWNSTVGPAIARNAQPEKIRNGTLFVKVASSTWMQELQYMKEMISEKLNENLGKPVVKNIFFYVGKLDVKMPAAGAPEPPAARSGGGEARLDDAELQPIKDPELRRALKRLYAARARKGKR
jgi:hypothetical protein